MVTKINSKFIKERYEIISETDQINVTGDVVEDMIAVVDKVNHKDDYTALREYLTSIETPEGVKDNVQNLIFWFSQSFKRLSEFGKMAGGFYPVLSYIEHSDLSYYAVLDIWKHRK